MAFNHKKHKRFYSDYAVKQHHILTEDTVNLYGKRLKKEVDDTFNRFQVTNSKLAIEWDPIEEYEVGEIASYHNKNYECTIDCINKEPSTQPNYWKEVGIGEYTEKSFDNYLGRDNQEPYDPRVLKDGEKTTDFHPATKKYVDDELTNLVTNVKVENANRLDGFDSSHFATNEQIFNIRNEYSRIDQINNTLTSNATDRPLSAQQGKVLKSMIDRINRLLGSNDVSLDELQEIVNYIKNNRNLIDTLGIESINGLRSALNNLQSDINSRVPLSLWNSNGFIERIHQIDGAGSGLDADLLDGKDSSYFLPAATYNSADVISKLKAVDGAGSGLDADLLDGLDSTAFLRRNTNDAPSVDNTYSLGTSSRRWSNIYANNFIGTALKAKYADLSEVYECDNYNDFEYGDVIGIDKNGNFKHFSQNDKLIGIITKNPGFVLNHEVNGINIALKGQTPVKVKDNFAKIGQYLIVNENGDVIGKDDYSFDESKRLLGIAISDIEDGYIICKI